MKIEIINLKRKEDLTAFKDEFATWYNSGSLNEGWTSESALNLFNFYYEHFKDLIFVAYVYSTPAGIIFFEVKPWSNGNHLVNGELFVLNKYRKEGIASLLVKKELEYAIEKYKITDVEFLTYEDENGFPFSWYKKSGFKKDEQLFLVKASVEEIIKHYNE